MDEVKHIEILNKLLRKIGLKKGVPIIKDSTIFNILIKTFIDKIT